MTRAQAIEKLITTRDLTTAMLEPLGIEFDTWLQWCQRSDAEEILDKLVAHYEKGAVG